MRLKLAHSRDAAPHTSGSSWRSKPMTVACGAHQTARRPAEHAQTQRSCSGRGQNEADAITRLRFIGPMVALPLLSAMGGKRTLGDLHI